MSSVARQENTYIDAALGSPAQVARDGFRLVLANAHSEAGWATSEMRNLAWLEHHGGMYAQQRIERLTRIRTKLNAAIIQTDNAMAKARAL